MLYETKFLISLILTLIIEIPILFIFCKIFKVKVEKIKIFFIGFLASGLTLPYLWFIFPAFLSGINYIIFGELFAFLFEALIYNQLLELKIKKALFISLIANLVSFLIGLIIF